MPIKVYGTPTSTCTQRVLTTLIEKGLPYELIKVNLAAGEQKTQEYLDEKQPFGVVPVLIDEDGFKIYESRAICRYLELKYKGKGTELMPTNDVKALGLFEQAASIEMSYYDPMKGLGDPDEAKIALYREQLNAKLDVYEKILSKQPYLAGQDFTLADLFHLSYGNRLVKLNEGHFFESRPHVKDWWNRITSRPSWQQVLALA
ncbi:unnamed protein product [Rotaria sordida]|uniref:glutathione transferase n=1 Tax=Rotaria sordida TaxID=392033 RepID=A0A814FW63_9BILA|nr:unnamed protein product [Rotaria sordida]CAF1071691.1 unnamed protein product [Rotaria sordida]CAF1148710.1 unnamed protein product [Rotaria sordida]